jgi:hypothetical protein
MIQITYDEFEQVEICVGNVTKVETRAEAFPAEKTSR